MAQLKTQGYNKKVEIKKMEKVIPGKYKIFKKVFTSDNIVYNNKKHH